MWNSVSSSPPLDRPWYRAILTTAASAALVGLLALTTSVRAAMARRAGDTERGDVPGWVMVTLMTAGLVAVVWLLADEWLRALFQQAVDRVSGP